MFYKTQKALLLFAHFCALLKTFLNNLKFLRFRFTTVKVPIFGAAGDIAPNVPKTLE